MSKPEIGRSIAIVIVFMVVAAIVTRVYLNLPENNGSVGAALWQMMRYFTILTNALVAILLALHIWYRPQSASLLAGTTLAISIVGVVFHLLLSHLVDLEGIEILIDLAFHTFVPLMTFVWWVFFAPKSPLSYVSPLSWLIWPGVYAVYAVARGKIDSEYPYYFLNLGELGWGGLAVSVGQFLLAFLVAGYALYGLARLIHRYSSNPG